MSARKIVYMTMMIWIAMHLSSCGNQSQRLALEAYVQKVKSRNIKEIEPFPEIKPYEPFTYTAYNLRSPFVPFFPEEVPKKVIEEGAIHPDFNRRKEALESFPIDALRMVGTIEKERGKWALVVDPKGSVYRLTKGNYVGQNHGRIESVTDDKIMISEIIPDPSGGWRDRKVSMMLNSNDNPKQNQKHK